LDCSGRARHRCKEGAIRSVSVRARRLLAGTSIALGVVTVGGVIAMWPRGEVVSRSLRDAFGTSEVFDAKILTLHDRPCEGTLPEDEVTCRQVSLLLLGGPDEGETFAIEFPTSSAVANIDEGSTIVVTRQPQAPPDLRYGFVDVQRTSVLVWLALVFALAVVLLGRLRGLAALLGLLASLYLLLAFVLPTILSGRSPMLVALFGASAIAYVALYLAHGFGPMTSIALLGTLASLMLTVVLGSIFTDLARFSGFASEEAFLVQLGANDLNLSGLILAGVIIGSLGAVDDMTVTQASAVAELADADPNASRGTLLRSGLRIGRDHVSSTVNTLFLAYAGASLPLLLLFVLTDQPWPLVANREIVATEIVRALVGSIGLVASVPLTTWLSALAYSSGRPRPAREQQRAPGRRDRPRAEPDDNDRGWVPESRLDLLRRRKR
jgi:uncharacterized membrane protein